MLFKLIMYGLIAYLAYKLIAGPKRINPPSDRRKLRRKNRDDDFSDYEEID